MFSMLIAVICQMSLAERIEFTRIPVPANQHADGLRMFHVYSKGDFAELSGSDTWHIDKSVVEMHLVAHTEGEKVAPLEMSLVHVDDFTAHFDQKHFCKDHQLWLRYGAVPKDGRRPEMFSTIVPFEGSDRVTRVPLNKTGTWVLLLSNCGETRTDMTVSGTVQVRNPYGYLPPESYHKIAPLYVFLFQYIMIAAAWAAYALAHREQVAEIHFFFTTLLVLSLAEVAVQLFALEGWNADGAAQEPWSSLAVVLSVLKWVYLYWISAFSASGLPNGATGDAVIAFFNQRHCLPLGLACIYSVFITLRETVMSDMQGHSSLQVVLVVNGAVSMMDAAALIYILAQTRLHYMQEERKHNISEARFFLRLHRLAVVCAVPASIAYLINLGNLLGLFKLSWSSMWIPQDGAAHVVAMIAITGGIYCMRPGMVSIKSSPGGSVVEALEAGERSSFLSTSAKDYQG